MLLIRHVKELTASQLGKFSACSEVTGQEAKGTA